MGWQPSIRLLRRTEIIMASIASCNILLIVASIGFGMGSQSWTNSNLLLLPQVLVNLYSLFYAYFKHIIIHKWFYQLVLSNFLAGAYIFFAVSVFKITSIDTRQFLIRTVEGASVVLAALLITNSILTVIVVKREKIDRPPDDDTPLSRGTDEPPQIHIYQPRIDLTPPPLDQPDGGQDSVVTAQSPFPSSIQAAHQRRDHLLERGDGSNDNLELEILPMYQRKAPSQRVTIIDLSNLESVDPVVLNNVLGGEERGEEGGGESAQLGHSRQNSSTIAAVVASSSSTITSTIIRAEAEVPAYSPPLTTLNGVEEDLASLTPPTVSPSTLGSTPVVADETEHESNPSTIITISPSEGISATTTIGPNDPPVYMP